jgi:molybdopterin molybdotransferase
MIDFETAEQLLHAHLPLLETEKIVIQHSNGRVLAEDIIAPMPHPFFDQSSVDGYLFYFADKEVELSVTGEIAAGSALNPNLQRGEAIRIFTGAPVPENCGDTIVMQEYVTKNGNDALINIKDAKLKLGANIRKKGEQLKKGAVTLKASTLLNPTAIGFLASIGITEISVFKKPKVCILVTGNEFALPHETLENGKIYDSNGVMLQAALKGLGLDCLSETIKDDLDVLKNAIAAKVNEQDVLIITGGVSVGDYDFTLPALEQNGFEMVFHKVHQKPGKPILFMKRSDGKVAFGLPGNPRSAIMGYYLYVLPSLLKMMGHSQPFIAIEIPIGHDFKKMDDGKTHFLSGILRNHQVWLNEQQASHMLLSLATAQVIAILPPQPLEYKTGDWLRCRMIPLV